jgi:hypothetical protein
MVMRSRRIGADLGWSDAATKVTGHFKATSLPIGS